MPTKIKTFVITVAFSVICSNCNSGRTEAVAVGRGMYEERLNEVDIAILRKTAFIKEIISNGRLTALKKSELKFKASGQLKELKVRNGISVTSGQIIAVMDQFESKRMLEHAEISVKKAAIELEDALVAYGGTKIKRDSIRQFIYDGAAISTGYISALNELKTAQYNLEETVLRAPFSGKVANVRQKVYELVNNAEVFCTVIDDSKFEVEFHLLESEIGEIALNDKVRIVPFSSNSVYKGAVSEINPLIDENGLVLVKAVVNNNGTLWEGMNVKVVIEKEVPEMLVVPKSAIVQRQNQDVIFRYSKGHAIWTYVERGLENSHSYCVIPDPDKGGTLEQLDTIVISNNLNLAHGSKVVIKK